MNVVLIVVDALCRDGLSVYDDSNSTPRLAEIASRSLVLDDVTAASCWTMPTHASMFTGLYPSRHRAIEPRVRLDDSVPFVSEMLSESGFRTHAINIPHPLSWDSGFDRG